MTYNGPVDEDEEEDDIVVVPFGNSRDNEEEPEVVLDPAAAVAAGTANDDKDDEPEPEEEPKPPSQQPLFLTEATKIKILSENGTLRLDIGRASMRSECKSSHNAWATRFWIRRLDDVTDLYGPIRLDGGHVIGIFSETEHKRLCLGPPAVRRACPPEHESWATRLFVKRLDRNNNKDEHTPICYNELVGIFASDEDGKPKQVRLDIGRDSVYAETAHDEECDATRLCIQPV